MINIKKGLDLPIGGKPEQSVNEGPQVKHVALIGTDYIGLRPSMAVEAGQKVKKGQVLFEDKKNPGTRFTAPAAGTVVAVNRGERRAFQSLVIEVDPNGESVEFKKTSSDNLLGLSSKEVVDELVESGMWTAFRTRPFDKVPVIGSLPHSIFVTAMDTNPLAADPKVIIDAEAQAFADGLKVLSRIGDFKVYVCKGAYELPSVNLPNVQEETFVGQHPAGLAGVHIHNLDPVSETKTVWHIGYQDVIAIGHLFVEGELYNARVISIAGPQAKNPRLVKTLMGASTAELVADEILPSASGVRVISGTVLWGNIAVGPYAYMGRYHQGIALLEEGKNNEFFLANWMGLGARRHSATRAFLANFIKPSSYIFNTALNGGPRSILPIGCYEKVLAPYDVEAIMLCRAIDMNDTDQAKLLGILEFSEEDIALATYVCPGKNDFGPMLRRSLTKIEVEG
ncbi:Na+-transporting NADH:ubiquinone oxidoreductase subunit A [Succinivibrio dextrinosolvens]|uniref:Na(+)-translocating NADH-quinone reductase subunit A n=1 Tax=Succinivibrio dextrinosolvens TaxID=83771 RepID=UPI0008E20860|nr:Na(+)-translocating NADH-quinone reductase subunit A [Succinivibrio dextrinosolvens]SFS42357.1 Na+-transporting NADH:ubiquinone oxidoreductase subunit A [Succinivibrio dextrinosolvens]